MNLVKAQEYAASLPLAELKKYADGFNPAMIPPWLATGEMQAKMKRAEMANNLQGAAQGPIPSVKEQVEQKAGIMALQQAQQQQAAQRPMPVAGPVPDGTPQPTQQPQAPGLDQLQSNIEMAGGGIVAFSGEDGDSEVEGKKKLRQVTQREMAEEYNRKRFAQQAEDEAARSPEARKDSEGIMKALSFVAGLPVEALKTLVSAPGYGFSKDAAPTPQPAAQATGADMGMPTDVGAPAATNVAAMRQPPQGQRPGLPQALPAAQNKPSVAPAATATPAPNSMDALYRQSLENKPKERTVQDLIAEQNAIRAGTGLEEPAGKAQLDRIAALNKQYESTKPTGLQELIKMFGQSGQYKGLSGLAPAYTSIEEQKRAADLAHAQKINEMMSGVETTQRAEKTGVAGKVSEGRAKDRELGSQFDRDVLKTLEGARGQDIQAATARDTAATHLKGVMAQVAARGDARANLTPAQRSQIADKAVDNVTALLKQDMRKAMEVSKNPALRDQLIQRETERLFQAATGLTIDTAPSAASPSGTSTSGWGKAQVVK